MVKILDNLKTLLIALVIAVLIRSLLFQPFYIPSASMQPSLLIGDRIFVSKYSYGYSKHSFPFSPNLIKGRIFKKEPKRGDMVVFKTPKDNRTDYIKRIVGLPNDKIQFKDGDLFLNDRKIEKEKTSNFEEITCGNNSIDFEAFNEKISNKKNYKIVYKREGSQKNTDIYIIPDKHYFLIGDNRDCSRDSRFLSDVGYVHEENLVGKAQIIFFSNDTIKSSVLKFWNWNDSFRAERFFKRLK
tara:strand:- start:421 stop:1146 length:726 start_codon:yes stop_codon:yes gene_type:complete